MMDAKEVAIIAYEIMNPAGAREACELLSLEDGVNRALEYLINRVTWDFEMGVIDQASADKCFRRLGIPHDAKS